MNIKVIFPLLAAVCASAQPSCPPINFLNAKTVNLHPSDSSHVVVLRQDDGSYTAFELANASPYAVLRTIPHFEKQFSNCLPRQTPGTSKKPSLPAPNAPGAAAQAEAFAVLDSGNYLFVSAGAFSLDVVISDRHLQLISENQIGALPPGPGVSYNSYLSLVLDDVNGDGKLDVIAQYGLLENGKFPPKGGGVQIFLGDGLGGFQPAGGFTLDGFLNGSMAVGDLNGDGKPDIAVGTAGPALLPGGLTGSIVLAIGKGDGTFVKSILPTPNESGPATIVIADLNGDGKNDLVFLTCFLSESANCTPNEVAVALNKGDGTFSSQTVFPVAIAASDNLLWPAAIAVGDVNGDGIPDIVSNGITILLGDGKGGFPTRKDSLNTVQEPVVLTDFDGDGKMDVVIGAGNPLVLSSPNFQSALTVFFGDGAGGLTAPPFLPSPTPAIQRFVPFSFPQQSSDVALTSGDFNKDGIADLAFVSELQYLSVFLGSASGTLTPVFTYDFAAVDQQANPTSVVAADFNQDGILDLAVTVARPSSPGSILVFLGKGDGTFLPPVSSSAPGSIWSLVTGDFNKDGRPDLAAINTSPSFEADQVVVFRGQGDGTFASPRMYPAGSGAFALVARDFNQDGFADIAIAYETGINFLLGKGDGTFSPGTNISFPGPGSFQGSLMSLAAADFNGDGKLDLVAGVSPAGAAILLGHGDGTFRTPAIYPSRSGPNLSGADLISVVVADINGDGIPDLFLGDSSVLIGNGDGTFGLQTPDLPALFGPLIAADFNGDGKVDVASGFSSGQPRHGATVFFNLSQPTALLNVVSAADFSSGPLSPHSIVSAFGKHLALSTASGKPPSLPNTLGGATVTVQDRIGAESQAGIYYASPEQVNFLLPAGLETGTAIVTIKTTDGQSASAEIQIAPVAPKIFIVDPSGVPAGYAVRVGADNVQTVEPIFTEQGGHVEEVPIDLSAGDVYLVLFGTGFDGPQLSTGAEIARQNLFVSYAGPQPQFPGLDQVNILLPKSLAGSGRSSLVFFCGERTTCEHRIHHDKVMSLPACENGGMTRAVLWDMDGTLVDSEEYHWLSWRDTMRSEGITITHVQFLKTFGQRNDSILPGWLGDRAAPELIQRIGDAKEELYRKLVRGGGLEPLPGALEWVERLGREGWPQAMASSAPLANIDVVLEVIGLARSFQAVVSAEDVTAGKPDPQVFLTAAARLNTPPARCIVVEDAVPGVEAARRAGMRCIGVSRKGLLAGADVVIQSLADLPSDAFERLGRE